MKLPKPMYSGLGNRLDELLYCFNLRNICRNNKYVSISFDLLNMLDIDERASMRAYIIIHEIKR